MLDHRQLGLHGPRGEKINTQRALLVAEALATLSAADFSLEYLAEVLDVPQYNDVPRVERAREMLRVWGFYPAEFIAYAYAHPPAWHKLVEPVGYGEDRDVVVSFFQNHIDERGNWPSIAGLRTRFGRASNHRPEAAKAEGQGALL